MVVRQSTVFECIVDQQSRRSINRTQSYNHLEGGMRCDRLKAFNGLLLHQFLELLR